MTAQLPCGHPSACSEGATSTIGCRWCEEVGQAAARLDGACTDFEKRIAKSERAAGLAGAEVASLESRLARMREALEGWENLRPVLVLTGKHGIRTIAERGAFLKQARHALDLNDAALHPATTDAALTAESPAAPQEER